MTFNILIPSKVNLIQSSKLRIFHKNIFYSFKKFKFAIFMKYSKYPVRIYPILSFILPSKLLMKKY